MKHTFKKILSGALAALAVITTTLCFTGCGLEHIEDTNGADNYELTTITDQQIIDRSTGSMNVIVESDLIGDMVTVRSSKFTGVYEVFYVNYIGKSDFMIDLYGLNVTSATSKCASF